MHAKFHSAEHLRTRSTRLIKQKIRATSAYLPRPKERIRHDVLIFGESEVFLLFDRDMDRNPPMTYIALAVGPFFAAHHMLPASRTASRAHPSAVRGDAGMHSVFHSLLLVLFAADLSAQTCLSLSSPSVSGDRTVTLDISLHASPKSRPAAIQWTLSTSSSSVTSITADDGPELPSGRKAVICAGPAAAYRCIIVGANAEPVPDGIVARITLGLAPGTPAPKITLGGSMAASTDGHLIPIAECSPLNRKE
jgi:hypothetical protein